MGDMADYTLEQIEQAEEERFEYRRGGMSDLEAYDLGIIDEHGAMYTANYGSKQTKTCRACGAGGLTWGQHKGKWRLFNNGVLHDCPIKPLNE